MIVVALLLTLGAQQQGQPQEQPRLDTRPAPWPDTVEDAENIPDNLASIERTYKRASCVVDASGPKVAAALAKDHRSLAYRQAFTVIFQNNADCFGKRSRKQSPTLMLTGAMAERLLAADTAPLNVRLARAAAAPAPQAVSDNEAAALCTVRSMPDDVAKWLATSPDSAESAAAAQPVAMIFGRCGGDLAKTKLTMPKLRALMALAALRSTNPGGTAAASN